MGKKRLGYQQALALMKQGRPMKLVSGGGTYFHPSIDGITVDHPAYQKISRLCIQSKNESGCPIYTLKKVVDLFKKECCLACELGLPHKVKQNEWCKVADKVKS